MPELDRRDFLKLVGVGAGATVAAGCTDPVEKLIPYVIQPETITPGVATYYASTCRECPAACGLHVRTREGRPVKLEGNPAHPVNKGALCARGQAAIGRTYHPDRFPGPMKRGVDGKLAQISWDEAVGLLSAKLRESRASTFVLGSDRGPSVNRVISEFVDAVGAGGHVGFEPFAEESLRAAAETVFGITGEPLFDLSGADFVLSLGADFVETWQSPTEHARQLSEARDVASKPNGGARFVYVGPRLGATAASADEWIAARPGSEGLLALALAKVAVAAGAGSAADRSTLQGLLAGVDVASVATRAGVDAAAIERIGRALAKAQAPVVLPPGGGLASRRAVASTSAVLVLNQLLGAVGKTVHVAPARDAQKSGYKDLLALADGMKAGRVKLLLVHDADPVHSMPAGSGFAEALAKVDFVVSFASSIDDTANVAHLVLPDHTPLESWGDALPRAGVRSLQQPTFRPLFDTRALPDTLLDVARTLGADTAAKLPQGSFRTILEAAWSDTNFREALGRGGVFSDVAAAPAPSLAPSAAKLEVAEPLLEGDGEYVLLAHPSPLLHDGRGANLPWLQETPDPVTKIVWQSWAEVSRETAKKLGLETGAVVSVTTAAGSVELPIYARGGLRSDVIAIAAGQGHRAGLYASHENDGRPGEARGVNVNALLPAAADEAGGRAWLCARAKIQPTGRTEKLIFAQYTDNKRKRQLGEAVTLASLLGGADAQAEAHAGAAPAEASTAHGGGHASAAHGAAAAHHGPHEIRPPYDATQDAAKDALHRWGMSIDLDRCTGCSACVVACYVENNLPIVGEDQARWGRLMAWLRIERWIGDGDDEELIVGRPPKQDHEELGGAVDVRHSPMVCQQCGAAPCEPVCPVIATYHNPEGLNGMVYNRCIGTRYCANNCPYKVRKYNWYDFDRENWPGALHLMLNPDVTVRGQGVMEKCTFCVQRIEFARQDAKDGKRAIRDGEVTTACAQSCPTQAISFGNLKDAESQVSKKSADPKRGYHALHYLNTRPAVTYLAKVTRGPVEG